MSWGEGRDYVVLIFQFLKVYNVVFYIYEFFRKVLMLGIGSQRYVRDCGIEMEDLRLSLKVEVFFILIDMNEVVAIFLYYIFWED